MGGALGATLDLAVRGKGLGVDGARDLATLGKSATADPDQALTVAREFESLLVNEVFKAMRQTVPESPLFGGGFSNDVFTSMLDEQLARQAAEGGSGFGLAETMAQQMGGGTAPSSPLSVQTALALNDGTWVRPVDEDSLRTSRAQRFGAARPGHVHQGLDLDPGEGTPVRVAGDGVVRAVSRNPDTSGGLTVEVAHRGGAIVTRYLHLADIRADLTPGSHLSAGEEIGTVGDTGTASRGAHLHFEIEEHLPSGAKKPLDPEGWVKGWPQAGGTAAPR